MCVCVCVCVCLFALCIPAVKHQPHSSNLVKWSSVLSLLLKGFEALCCHSRILQSVLVHIVEARDILSMTNGAKWIIHGIYKVPIIFILINY